MLTKGDVIDEADNENEVRTSMSENRATATLSTIFIVLPS
jgi:hypothetical protein